MIDAGDLAVARRYTVRERHSAPKFLAAHGASVAQVGLVAAVYPAVWALTQIATGHWSDTVGRKPLITSGMLLQAAALGILALSGGSVAIAAATAVLLGLGTAMVYPTLIAAISDAVTPVERAPMVGVYRFWRDSGYALGALIAGATADALGYGGAIAIIAALTAASGLWVLGDMPNEPHRSSTRVLTLPGMTDSPKTVPVSARRWRLADALTMRAVPSKAGLRSKDCRSAPRSFFIRQRRDTDVGQRSPLDNGQGDQ